MRVLFLTRYGQMGASSRMRCFQYIPWFENMGMKCTATPLFDDCQLAQRYRTDRYELPGLLLSYFRRVRVLWQKRHCDLIWIEKEALPWFPVWFERWLLGGVPFVLDYDDAIFHNYDLHPSPILRYIFGKRIDRMMVAARLVVAGNQYIAQRAWCAGARKVEILATVIDLERYPRISGNSHVQTKPLNIVWIGSPSSAPCLELLNKPLLELSHHFLLNLRVIGCDTFTMPGVKVERLPWSETTEHSLISSCDIGVMPLGDSPWEKGKCGYKLIQYMACELPVVASPVGVNSEIVRIGENGFLATSEKTWVDALGKLLSDAALRDKMGAAGRKRVEEAYCIQKAAPRLAQLLRDAVESRLQVSTRDGPT